MSKCLHKRYLLLYPLVVSLIILFIFVLFSGKSGSVVNSMSFLKIVHNLYSQTNDPYLSILNNGVSPSGFKMVFDNKSYSSIDDLLITIGINNQQDDEVKILKIYNFLTSISYHHDPPTYKSTGYEKTSTQFINSWGYGYCADVAHVFSALSIKAGIPSRVVYITDHVVSEVFYHNSWHMIDVDRRSIYRKNDKSIASVVDVFNNLHLLKQNLNTFRNQYKAFSPKKIKYYRSQKEIEVHKINLESPLIYYLYPYEELRFYLKRKMQFYSGFLPSPPPIYGNGVLFSNNPFLYHNTNKPNAVRSLSELNKIPVWDNKLINASIEIKLPHPIVQIIIINNDGCIVSGYYFFSLNNKDWKQIIFNCADNFIDITSLIPIGKNSSPVYNYYLKKTGYIPYVDLVTVFQYNPLIFNDQNSGFKKISVIGEKINNIIMTNN